MESHRAYYGFAIDQEGQKADEVILLPMKGPRSYTGEDVVEISCHGGPVPVQVILSSVLAAGATMAEPGEFTRRAFLNGRMDLSQAEAVADIIESHSRAGARLALRHLEGELGEQISQLRQEILEVMAGIEVVLDYPEMEIEQTQRGDMIEQLQAMKAIIGQLVDTATFGRPFREGVRTVILGRPNVGKSSLMNALLRRERAIVTDIPGTTRDVVSETIVVGGVPLIVMDTAGIRTDADRIEQLGVERARRAAADADLILLVFDDSEPLQPADEEICRMLTANGPDASVVVVINKIDLRCSEIDEEYVLRLTGNCDGSRRLVRVSAKTREGVDRLAKVVAEVVLHGRLPVAGESIVVTNARHEEILGQSLESLSDAVDGLKEGIPADLVNIDLRRALEQLGRITGETATEDLLDRIFADFCVGK